MSISLTSRPMIATVASAALRLDILTVRQLASQDPAAWHDVLGIVGFERWPELSAAPTTAPVPTTMSGCPILGGGEARCEVWRITPAGVLSQGDAAGGRVHYRYDDALLFGSITVEEGRGDAADLVRSTESAYHEVFAVLEQTGHRHLIRIWNYLPDINLRADGEERYRLFNSARQMAFRTSGRATMGSVPAACALGTRRGSPISIYFLAARRPPTMIENPRQTSAYHYPPKFGRHSPIFSRACVLPQSVGVNLFISGTASIVGHETVHRHDVASQTRETLANIKALLAEANRIVGASRYSLSALNFKVYVRRPADLAVIEAVLQETVRPGTNVLYLLADICREDLLVEIEATGGSEC